MPLSRLAPSPAAAAHRLGLFLARRHWLRPRPDTPLQLVHIPPPPPPLLPTTQTPPLPSIVSHTSCVSNASITPAFVHSANIAGAGAGVDVGAGGRSFFILRDDLIHPVLGGNKVRKLDALLPELLNGGVSDVVTCGGVQSAHLAAVAVAGAELGLRTHLLVRGEPPKVPTGYHLVTRMYGTRVSYASRSEYADRQAMLTAAADEVTKMDPAAKVAVVAEGGGDPAALLGLLRLVHWLVTSAAGADTVSHMAPQAGGLSRSTLVRTVRELPDAYTTPYKLVVDTGTGTTAIGLALAVALLGLPWRVLAVVLAGDVSYYESQKEQLVHGFLQLYGTELYGIAIGDLNMGGSGGAAGRGGSGVEAEGLAGVALPLDWRQRQVPRRFGRVLDGEIETCKEMAQKYGIGLDPIYSLAAWEIATMEAAISPQSTPVTTMAEIVKGWASPGLTCPEKAYVADVAATRSASDIRRHTCSDGGLIMGNFSRSGAPGLWGGEAHVVMLHSGGALGLHGLAQRLPGVF